MLVRELDIAGVLSLKPKRFSDDRGWFSESHNRRTLEGLNLRWSFVQDNHSYSRHVGTIRGFHFQTAPHAQDKLVRCVRGKILDIAVDLRAGSPTFATWAAAELSAENGEQLFVPIGFAHAFITLEPDTEVIYKVTDYYAPECDGGIRWEPAGAPHLSVKDTKLPFLRDM